MADEKEPKTRASDRQPEQAAAEKPKPKARRSTAAKKPAASTEEKPKRTRTPAKAKVDEEAKPKAPARRRAAPKKKAADSESSQPVTESPQADQPVAEAPARRRRAAPKKETPKAPAVRPVVTARARYVRSSARKARLVLDHVRGKPIGEARALLQLSPRGVARDVERLLASAIANAENNHDLVGEDLYVKEIYADEGPTLKRFRARAQGRAYRVRKRTSHLTVALTPKE
jgi:ribosomal protein L22